MTSDTLHLGIAIITFVVTGVGAVIRVSYIVGQQTEKIGADIEKAIATTKAEFNALLQLKEAEYEAKIGKVWERFDTYKNVCDGTFVRQQTCQLIHNGTERALQESNRRMESVEKKIDALIVALVEKKEN